MSWYAAPSPFRTKALPPPSPSSSSPAAQTWPVDCWSSSRNCLQLRWVSHLKSRPLPRVRWPPLTHQWPVGRPQRPSPLPQFRTKETLQLQRPPVGRLAELPWRPHHHSTSPSAWSCFLLPSQLVLRSCPSELTSQSLCPGEPDLQQVMLVQCLAHDARSIKSFPGFLLTSCTSYSNASPPESLLCLWRPQKLAIPCLTDTEGWSLQG